MKKKGMIVFMNSNGSCLGSIEKVKGVDGLLSQLTDRVDGDLMDAAGPQLKVVSNYAVGFDNIDIQTATRKKIPVGHTPGVLTETCADFTFSLLASLVLFCSSLQSLFLLGFCFIDQFCCSGISFLNDILQPKGDYKANRVLNQMREKVMKALHQTGERSITMDSIDIALCILNTETGMMQFAGANRPLLMVRNRELYEYKPDKMPIGLAPLCEQTFTNQVIETRAGDTFYLFSDGYSDQFGEMTDKKFKQKNLKRVINSVAALPMQRQREVLENTFLDWKGRTQQVDDVLVFGFTI